MMIRITLKGNPGLTEEVMIMKLYLIIKTICEKILLLREEIAGLLVRLQGRFDANAPETTPARYNYRALQTGARRSTGSEVPASLAGCAHRAHLGLLRLREESIRSPHSPVPAPTGVGDALDFYLPAEKKTKSVWVLRTKVLTSDPFGYLLNAEHRGAMRAKRQIAAKQKG